jgi:NitT/TauT family transport system permease protein
MKRRAARESLVVLAWQIGLLVAVLAAWQWVPSIPGIHSVTVSLDPFFISSPERVAKRTWRLLLGTSYEPTIWKALWATLEATLIGAAIGIVLGGLMGLILSGYDRASRVLKPYIVAANAVPRIALIPIFIIIAHPGLKSSVLSAVFLVVFIVFFNAWEGGRSVPIQMLQNAAILGAPRRDLMFRVRFPIVLAWIFAVLPNAVTFALVGVVATELLSGPYGMGGRLTYALDSLDATLTFSIVLMLSVVGVTLVLLTSLVRSRVLHWWDRGGAVGIE